MRIMQNLWSALRRSGVVILFLAICSVILQTLHAQVPQLINYQGRIVVGSTNFAGTGSFKFALVNAAGTTAYWTNDGTHLDGTEPTNAVALSVSNGLYSVLLGDASLTNMAAAPGRSTAPPPTTTAAWSASARILRPPLFPAN